MRGLEKAFDHYGRFVARHPFPFVIVPLIITAISSIGVLNFHSQDDIWDIYAPLNARSRVEEKALEKFEYMSSANHYRLQVIVDRKDSKNIMNIHDMAEIAAVNKFISENMTVEAGGKQWVYRELCGVYCNDSNSLVIGIIRAILDSRGEMSRFKLTYPTTSALHNHIFMGYSIGQLKLERQNDQDVIREFRLFILHYMINMRLPNALKIRSDFEAQLLKFFTRATIESPNLSYALLSRNRELEEQRKITTTAIPYLFVTGGLLSLFMIITLVDRPLYKSQFIEAVFGILSPAMALVTTFGLVWGIGYPFSNILTVVPFLVITIGIDDAFLILAGWRNSNPNEDLEVRIGESIAKSGASVSVTSVTDVLCFGVGIFSNLPVVQLFCLYTSVALTIDFIYQLTFFLAITVYSGRRQLRLIDEHRIQQLREEIRNASNSKLHFKTIIGNFYSNTVFQNADVIKNNGDIKLKDNVFAFKNSNNKKKSTSPKSKSLIGEGNGTFSVNIFIDILLLRWVQAIIFGIFSAHLLISLYLCTLVNTDFDMKNLYLRDSPLTPISQKMQNFLLKESFVVNFVLQEMESFESANKRRLFNNMIEELENIPRFGMNDSRGTSLWIRNYEAAASFWIAEDESGIWEPSELLRNFRTFNFDEKFIHTRKNKKGEDIISSFAWFITYHNMNNFLDVEQLLDSRREILKKYDSVFSVYSHHPLEKVPTESAKSAPINFIQTAVSAIVLMSILVFLCILNVEAIFSVILSIISISMGTVGYLHLWNVNLDAVSLISMLMSIGFSVDYSAHICYHFYTHSVETNKSKNKKKKSIQSLNSTVITAISTSPIQSSVATTTNSVADTDSCLSVNTNLPSVNALIVTKFENPKLGTSSHDSDLINLFDDSIRLRLIDTFNGVGWPVVQSGVSTVIGMIPLFFVDAYVVDVFWKTIVLVTALGMFHALILLPVLFIFISTVKRLLTKRLKTYLHKAQTSQKRKPPREVLGPITLRVND